MRFTVMELSRVPCDVQRILRAYRHSSFTMDGKMFVDVSPTSARKVDKWLRRCRLLPPTAGWLIVPSHRKQDVLQCLEDARLGLASQANLSDAKFPSPFE
jgi:hypothetical protein